MKKALSILGGLICGVVCIFLFIIQIGFITFTSVKTLITKDSISQVVKELDIKEIISTSPESTSDLYGFFDTLGFSVEETDKILEANAFKEFLDEYIYTNVDNILNDKDTVVEYDSVVKLVDDIEKETNITFKNKQAFLTLAKAELPKIQKSINISDTIRDNLDEKNIELIKALLGNTLTIAFVVIFVVTYFVMCLFRLSLYKPLIWYGITTTISSFIMLQVFIGINAIKGLITEEAKSFEFIITPVLKVIKNKGLIISEIMLIIGVLMIVAFYFINKKVKEEEKNENFEMLEDNQPENTETL